MKLHWSGSTRYHDWFENDFAVPKNMVEQLIRAEIIGNAEWVEYGILNKKENVNFKRKSLLKIFDFKPKKNDLFVITAGGSLPLKWELSIGLFPFQRSTNMVYGINTINIQFENDALIVTDGLKKLFDVFKLIHTRENTEFAFIHPYEKWMELTNVFYGKYGQPITFNPMLSGIYWVNFIGKKHLEYFDLTTLKKINSYYVEWIENDGLIVRITQNIEDCTTEVGEQEMFRITDVFKKALLKN